MVGSKKEAIDKEEFINLLIDLQSHEPPDVPIFEVYMRYYGPYHGGKHACLTSIIDPEYDHVISLEERCEHYKTLPYNGNLCDQPAMLIECFDHIRKANNDFEKSYFEKLKREQQSKKRG